MTDSARTLRGGLSRLRAKARSSASEPSLKERIEELEAEMQETRRLNRRLAELMDVVEELLVPLSQRDEEKVQQYLSSHTTTL
jgi:hypothetical protein